MPESIRPDTAASKAAVTPAAFEVHTRSAGVNPIWGWILGLQGFSPRFEAPFALTDEARLVARFMARSVAAARPGRSRSPAVRAPPVPTRWGAAKLR